ncbi:MAG: acyl-CoA transferase, partial [Actinomycetia bacterium]|nr:acyl-CoA transferase [Actinomycetes bacterium]
MGNDPAYYEHFSTQIRSALDTASTGGSPTPMVRQVDGQSLPSVFAVSDLAVASIAAAACEVSGLVSDRSGAEPAEVVVDRWLASQWFAGSIVPQGWQVKPAWDSIAGDYEGADGWIKLHTNAPHHRAAALKALGVEADREKVASAVARWAIDDLESAVLEAGGAAAAMRSVEAWRAHPNG